jgi:hypothetical protein
MKQIRMSLVKVGDLLKAGKVILALAALLLLASVALAQPGDGYDLPWWAVGGGGRESAGGNYALIGTIGQPDVGVLTAGNYTLVGGFWSGEGIPAEPETHPIYLPLILRQYP